MSSAPAAPTPKLPIALVRAERRREMLEHMSKQGMTIAERLSKRALASRTDADVLHRAEMFAKVARGVRLAVILEARIDDQILSYRKGDVTAFDEPDAVPGAGTPDSAMGCDDDGLDDDADDERLPTGGFRAWVEAICDDLGLDPDWSCWSEEEGFIRDDGQPVTKWPIRPEAPSAHISQPRTSPAPSAISPRASLPVSTPARARTRGHG